MSKSLRLSEKWFRRGLWLVALAFAGFLIGLGGSVVSDLPRMEQQHELDDFIDKEAAEPLRATIRDAERTEQAAERAQEQAALQLDVAQKASASARETFDNWIATRQATAQGAQDTEVIRRTQALDVLKARENEAQQRVDTQRQQALDARQIQDSAQMKLAPLETQAGEQLRAAYRQMELRVFGYRLALTLPLLLVAGWLFVKKRKSTWWPFVWGFIFFALFAFFVELVPYLPSYGGYVRYVVGIGITVLVGRYAILALNRYLERQKLAESLPDAQRREELGYDVVMARLGKSVCPGCERAVDLKNEAIDYCPHCGLCLFDRCGHCSTRKNAFSRYCFSCGTPSAAESVADSAAEGVADVPKAAIPGHPAAPVHP